MTTTATASSLDNISRTLRSSWMATNTIFDQCTSHAENGFLRDSSSAVSSFSWRNLEKRWMDTLEFLINHHYRRFYHEASTNVLENSSVKDFEMKWFHRIVQMHANMSMESDVKNGPSLQDISTNDDGDTKERRYYHTLAHLEEMFGYIDILIPYELGHLYKQCPTAKEQEFLDTQTKLYDAVINLAVFFHDAIYNPKSGTNEEDSVSFYQTFEESFLKRMTENNMVVQETPFIAPNKLEVSQQVEDFILATKAHTPISRTHSKDSPALLEPLHNIYQCVFLDADMAVLGKQTQAYNHYAGLIRMEYNFVPHDVYCSKRCEILESFASTLCNGAGDESDAKRAVKTVFLTQGMREALEGFAVKNLKEEIASLKRLEIPKAIIT